MLRQKCSYRKDIETHKKLNSIDLSLCIDHKFYKRV